MICPICNEDFLRCDEYGCWKDWAVLDNSKAKPKYSQKKKLILGAVILLCMGTGIYLGVCFGY
jgi:hypothetical protein